MARSEKLLPDTYYHVFNRTNNKERLFKDDENKAFFLRRLKYFLSPVCRIYCYCLLYNHLHILIKVRSEKEIQAYIHALPDKELTLKQKKWKSLEHTERAFHTVIDIQFNRLFLSYAKAFNKMWKREGNLFNRPFKRKSINNTQHLLYLVYYIQANSSKHGGDPDFAEYPWSSYPIHLSTEDTFLERKELLSWFMDSAGYIDFHQRPSPWQDDEALLIEE